MSGKRRTKRIILIGGVRYYADRPKNCKKCFFWKNNKVGCILGMENCYYLAEAMKTAREKECEVCCYAKGGACVSACCYKQLRLWHRAKCAHENTTKEGADHE